MDVVVAVGGGREELCTHKIRINEDSVCNSMYEYMLVFLSFEA